MMNAWKVRHEGSPVSSPDLTFAQVMQGLVDGRFSPEDEVKGPTEQAWVKLEDHPAFTETCPTSTCRRRRFTTTKRDLDMNALIDVCLVLLIFFILTTTYTQLQKIIDAAEATSKQRGNVKRIPQGQVNETMIRVEAKQSGDTTTVRVEGKEVPLEDLGRELRKLSGAANKVEVLLEHDADVPHGVIVAIQDAARSAKMEKVHLLVP